MPYHSAMQFNPYFPIRKRPRHITCLWQKFDAFPQLFFLNSQPPCVRSSLWKKHRKFCRFGATFHPVSLSPHWTFFLQNGKVFCIMTLQKLPLVAFLKVFIFHLLSWWSCLIYFSHLCMLDVIDGEDINPLLLWNLIKGSKYFIKHECRSKECQY